MKLNKTLAIAAATLLLIASSGCKPESEHIPSNSIGESQSAAHGGSSENGGASEGSQKDPENSGNGGDQKDPSYSGEAPSKANSSKSTSGPSVNPDPHEGGGAAYFNVKDYGAKADGKTDDSGAIAKAIAAAQKQSGGIVYLPAGLYLMNSGLDVPMGVTIRGEIPAVTKKWRKVSDLGTGNIAFESAGSSWLDASNFFGTWILVNHGAGDVDSHATFEIQGNASVYGLGFVHKENAPVVSKITKYPPALAVKNVKENPFTRDGMTIENIVLLNPYIGIALHAGNGKVLDHEVGKEANLYSLGRMRVHNVTGGAVYRGIIMKGLSDTVDLKDIEFGYTNMEKTYAQQRANHCADLEWYRGDGANARNIFSFGAKYGILITPAYISGGTSLRLLDSTLTGQYPMYITATGQYEIENCTFSTMNFNGLVTEKTFHAMTVIQDNTSIHQPFYAFSKLNLVNKIQSASVTDISLYLKTTHSGAAAMVVFTDTTFTGWSPGTDDPIIYYEAAGNSYYGYATFYNTKVTGGSGSGMLFRIHNVPNGGLQFHGGSLPQALISSSNNPSNTVLIK